MYVNSNDSTSYADLNELNYAQKVVTTYISFLQTKKFYDQVIEESNLRLSSEQLKAMTNVESINNTEIFEIRVSSMDPNESFLIVKSMEKIAPELIKSIKGTAQISIVDPPVLPTSPSSPNILKNTLIGGMIAFIITVLSSLLGEIMNVNVKNQEDLSKYQVPILGAIPNFNTNKKKKVLSKKIVLIAKRLKKRIVWKKNKKESKSENIIENTDKDTQFIITEAYNALRTNLKFTLRHEGCKKIVISSSLPEEGKSTISTNLGIVIGQTGSKVLLVDCDLRKGKLHNFFNIKSSPGVSNVLSNMIVAENVIQKTSYDNLYVLPLGTIPPNPSELIASSQMEELLKKLEREYDYIIIDTPPVRVVSDALSLMKAADGVLIVVREEVTSHSDITNFLSKCKFMNTQVLGFILNGISLNQDKKSKYHNYYYNNYNG
jgi:capsular exopolysaccharide synthesis family protein